MDKTTANKIKKIDQVILMTEKKLELLKELKESILYEAANFTLDRIGHPASYFLVDHKTNDIINAGPLQRVLKFIDRKGLKKQIYNPKNIQL